MHDTAPVGPADVSRRHCSLATLRSIIATWGERKRFREELAYMLRANPHLIDDIGLTRREVEAEIAKAWRPCDALSRPGMSGDAFAANWRSA